MNTDIENLALRAGPQTAVGLRTSGAPLASRLSVFARTSAGPATVLRSRSVADLDLRALRPAIDAPPELHDTGSVESLEEPRAPQASRFDPAPPLTTRGDPEPPPPITTMTEVSAPTVPRWPATTKREVALAPADAPVYSNVESSAPAETRAPQSATLPPVLEVRRSNLREQVDAPEKIAARHDASLPPSPARNEKPASPAPLSSVGAGITAPFSHEHPLPAQASASRNSTPEPMREARIATPRVERSEPGEPRPAAVAVPVAPKPMGTLHSTQREQAPKSRPQPAASVAALSKLKDTQRASQGETVRIGTVQVVVRSNAAPAPAPVAPAAPAARALSAPAVSAFRNVWLSRRRFE